MGGGAREIAGFLRQGKNRNCNVNGLCIFG